MIPDAPFIISCAQKNGRQMTPRLLDWLLLHFSDELWSDQYDDRQLLESLIIMYCDSYARQPESFTLPSPCEYYRERYNAAKDLIAELMLTIDELATELNALENV